MHMEKVDMVSKILERRQDSAEGIYVLYWTLCSHVPWNIKIPHLKIYRGKIAFRMIRMIINYYFQVDFRVLIMKASSECYESAH